MSQGATKAAQADKGAGRQPARARDSVGISPASDLIRSIWLLQAGAGNGAVTQLLGGGAPLADGVRAGMEERFGADFSDVRVHDDARSHTSAPAMGAKADTQSSDIVSFGGRFASGSLEGKQLLAHELAHAVQQQPGAPLDGVTRSAAERRLGGDLGDVRVHTDAQSDAMARHLSARAFTSGSDIAFRAGAYQPDTATGGRLLAHELAHVIQQRGRVHGAGPALGRPGDAFEQEANAASRGLDAGTTVQVAQPAAVPAVQMSGLSDLLPDVSGALGFAARKAFDALGPLDDRTLFSAIEGALRNPVLGPLIRAHPALAVHKSGVAMIQANPGAVEAVWKFMQDPAAYTAEIKAAIEPHFEAGKRITLEQGDRLLARLKVSQEHIEQIRPWLETIVGVAGSAFDFVWEDVIKDTLLFWRLHSERETYEQAWTNYQGDKIDTFDFIVECVSIVLSVLGRIEDLAPIVISAAGAVSGGAVGGGAGSVVPVAGTVTGAGTGSGVGVGAGAAASEIVGLAMVLGPAVLEGMKINKAIQDLLLIDQTDTQKQQDYGQIAGSAFSIVIMGVMAFLPGLALRLGKALARRLIEVISALATAAPRALPMPASGQGAPTLARSTDAPAAPHAAGPTLVPPETNGPTSVPDDSIESDWGADQVTELKIAPVRREPDRVPGPDLGKSRVDDTWDPDAPANTQSVPGEPSGSTPAGRPPGTPGGDAATRAPAIGEPTQPALPLPPTPATDVPLAENQLPSHEATSTRRQVLPFKPKQGPRPLADPAAGPGDLLSGPWQEAPATRAPDELQTPSVAAERLPLPVEQELPLQMAVGQTSGVAPRGDLLGPSLVYDADAIVASTAPGGGDPPRSVPPSVSLPVQTPMQQGTRRRREVIIDQPQQAVAQTHTDSSDAQAAIDTQPAPAAATATSRKRPTRTRRLGQFIDDTKPASENLYTDEPALDTGIAATMRAEIEDPARNQITTKDRFGVTRGYDVFGERVLQEEQRRRIRSRRRGAPVGENLSDPDVPPTATSLREPWQESELFSTVALAQLNQRYRSRGLNPGRWREQPQLIRYPTGQVPAEIDGRNVTPYHQAGGVEYAWVRGRTPAGSSIPEYYYPGSQSRRGRRVPPMSIEVKKATAEGDVPIFGDEQLLEAFVVRTGNQAAVRVGNMPPDARQYLLVDIRGQGVTLAQRADLTAMLDRYTGGVLAPGRVRFLMEGGLIETDEGVEYPFAD